MKNYRCDIRNVLSIYKLHVIVLYIRLLVSNRASKSLLSAIKKKEKYILTDCQSFVLGVAREDCRYMDSSNGSQRTICDNLCFLTIIL